MSRTTIPRRDLDRENAATVVNSDVSKRQMTAEERKRIFGDTDKQHVKDAGVKQRMAAAEEERRQEAKKAEQVKFDGRSSANEPVKQEFLQWIADGKSIAAFERQLGMKTNAMYYWVKKWELTGIKPGKARELLGLEGPPPQQEEIRPVALISVSEKAYKDLKDRLVDYENELARWAQIDNEKAVLNAELQEDLINWKTLAQKREIELNELQQAISELEDEREVLLETIEEAAIVTTTKGNMDPNSTYEALVSLDVLHPVKEHDNVNHPAHYTAGGIECIDAIDAALTGVTGGQAYATGAAIKYLWRWSHKNGIEDLQKAAWYVNRLILGLNSTS